jgi:hypothetical protein
MHGQESRGLINRKSAIRIGFDMEVRHSGVLFVEIVKVSRNSRAGSRELMRLFISAEYLHGHPSECGFVGPKLFVFWYSPLGKA